jgi:hypothetical protein
MGSKKEPHVVLYSCSQGFFHIEETAKTAANTLSNIRRGVRQDYVVVAFCNSFDEAFDKGLEIREIRAESPLWPGEMPLEEDLRS